MPWRFVPPRPFWARRRWMPLPPPPLVIPPPLPLYPAPPVIMRRRWRRW